MRKFLSERNFVIILFIVAFVVFSFAQEDAKKVEKMYQNAGSTASSLISAPKQTAGNIAKDEERLATPDLK
ncbi:MAG: hypothetical protein ACXWC7_00060 [Chitinophagaceae bacterium]